MTQANTDFIRPLFCNFKSGEIPPGRKDRHSDTPEKGGCHANIDNALSFASPLLHTLSESRFRNPNLDRIFPLYAEDRRHVLIEGLLEKWCRWRSSFKLRYFVLEKCGRLSYFKSDRDRLLPERAKRITAVHVGTSLAVAQTRGRDRITIEIKSLRGVGEDGRVLLLGFELRRDFERWQLALAEAQQSVHYVSVFIR